MTKRNAENCKEAVSREAVEIISSNLNKQTVLGIGSGTTILYFIRYLAEQAHENGPFPLKCVPTSFKTKQELLKYPNYFSILDWSVVSVIDIYIDGVDSFSTDFFLIKGKGGALFEEKLAFKLSKSIYIIADWTKQTVEFSACPIPIEIIPSSLTFVTEELQKLKATTTLREGNGKIGPIISENGNFLLDVEFLKKDFDNPTELERQLKLITGIVECGLFCPQPNMNILIANQDGTISTFVNK